MLCGVCEAARDVAEPLGRGARHDEPKRLPRDDERRVARKAEREARGAVAVLEAAREREAGVCGVRRARHRRDERARRNLGLDGRERLAAEAAGLEQALREERGQRVDALGGRERRVKGGAVQRRVRRKRRGARPRRLGFARGHERGRARLAAAHERALHERCAARVPQQPHAPRAALVRQYHVAQLDIRALHGGVARARPRQRHLADAAAPAAAVLELDAVGREERAARQRRRHIDEHIERVRIVLRVKELHLRHAAARKWLVVVLAAQRRGQLERAHERIREQIPHPQPAVAAHTEGERRIGAAHVCRERERLRRGARRVARKEARKERARTHRALVPADKALVSRVRLLHTHERTVRAGHQHDANVDDVHARHLALSERGNSVLVRPHEWEWRSAHQCRKWHNYAVHAVRRGHSHDVHIAARCVLEHARGAEHGRREYKAARRHIAVADHAQLQLVAAMERAREHERVSAERWHSARRRMHGVRCRHARRIVRTRVRGGARTRHYVHARRRTRRIQHVERHRRDPMRQHRPWHERRACHVGAALAPRATCTVRRGRPPAPLAHRIYDRRSCTCAALRPAPSSARRSSAPSASSCRKSERLPRSDVSLRSASSTSTGAASARARNWR